MTNQSAEVDEGRGEVESPAELTRRVVLRERVVKVVEALARRSQHDEQILGRVDALVVRPHAPHVRCAVDEPRDVEPDNVTQDGGDDEGVQRTLVPEVSGDERGKDETEQDEEGAVVSKTQRIFSLLPVLRNS